MEAARTLLTSPPPFPARNHLNKNSVSSSVLRLHEQAASSAVTSSPTSSLASHFPTSVFSREQPDEFRPLMNLGREDASYQAMLDRIDSTSIDQLMLDVELESLRWPGDVWNIMVPSQTGQNDSEFLTTPSISTGSNDHINSGPSNAIDIAKKALSATKEAVLMAQASFDLDSLSSTGVGSTSSSRDSLEEVKTIRSTRRLSRQSINRKGKRIRDMFDEPCNVKRADVRRKVNVGFHQNYPLWLFGPETKRLLTAEEETELIVQVQDLMRLEEVKSKLQSQFGREPTFFEWAEAVGLSCPLMKSQLHSGNRSREKLIHANLRMVVYVAKQYQNRGLSLQDLLQEGSMGLMKSVEKYKPQAGCRFASYAYYWIRQDIRKAIFKHSRIIRLPENVHSLLSKLAEAKRSFVQEGNHEPTKEELARCVGISKEKLESLISTTRMPLSMQQPVWADQDTTFQEITADTKVVNPEVSVAKQLMRQHVRGLLKILKPKERRIIRLRYGIEDGRPKSLSEIGDTLGLSKERVRQLESRALYKLKQFLDSHGLEAYVELIM